MNRANGFLAEPQVPWQECAAWPYGDICLRQGTIKLADLKQAVGYANLCFRCESGPSHLLH